MARIVLISCVSKKMAKPAPAVQLYVSSLFKKNLAYARFLKPDKIFILSAKHGLLPPSKKIAPYDTTLNRLHGRERRVWAKKVLKQLQGRVRLESDTFIFLAGERYRKYIVPHMKHVRVPMKGLGIGRQLAFLKRHVG